MRLLGSVSLRWRFAVAYTGVTLLAVLALAVCVDLVLARAWPDAYMWFPMATLAELIEGEPPPGSFGDRANVESWLRELATRAAPAYQRGELMLLALFDGEGRHIASRGHPVAERATVREVLGPDAAGAAERALAGEQRLHRTVWRDPEGRVFDCAHLRSGQGEAGVIVRQSALSMRGLLSEIGRKVLVLGLGAALLGVAFGLLAWRSVSARLSPISEAGRRWSRGELETRLVDNSPDELGQLARQLDAMAQRLAELLAEKHEVAVLEERERLSRDLHDSVKQQLFAASMQLEAAAMELGDEPRVQEPLAAGSRLVESAKRRLGEVIDELRPTETDDVEIAEALRRLAKVWFPSLETVTRVPSELRLAPAQSVALQQVAGEALANAARHSGATRVVIDLRATASEVVLTVSDNGGGFRGRPSPGSGIENMRARMTGLGGALRVERLAEGGTLVEARCPTTLQAWRAAGGAHDAGSRLSG